MNVLIIIICLLLPGQALAFPDTAVLDDFNRADDATPPPGTNWTSNIGLVDDTCGFTVVSNALGFGTSSTFWCTQYWNPSTFGPNAEAYISIPSTGTISTGGGQFHLFIGTTVGADGTFDGYSVAFGPGGTGAEVSLYRWDNGAFTQLGANISQGIDAGDAAGIKKVGDQICAWFNNDGAGWVEIGCRTDATYSSAWSRRVVVNATTGSVMVDDFGGGTLASAATRRPQAPVVFP